MKTMRQAEEEGEKKKKNVKATQCKKSKRSWEDGDEK